MTNDIKIQMMGGNEPQLEILTPPVITAPTATTVSRRFNVHALVPAAFHNKWNLDFFRASNNSKIKRYSGGWGAVFIEFVVPDELPVEEQIYFKIQYQSTLYSRWARSHNFKIGQPPTLQITNPVEGGTLDFGSSFSGINGYIGPGSRVSLQQAGGHEWAYAIPETNGRWTSTALPHGAGPQELYVRIDKGTEHSAYVARKFTIRPIMPRITHPVENGILDYGSSFSGTHGYSGAGSIVSLQQSGGHEWARATPNANGIWTSRALPENFVGRRTLYVRVDVGNYHSEYAIRNFSVKPPKPAISAPPNPSGLRQALTITGVASGTVSLEMFNEAGTKIGGNFSPTGTTRTFTPTADWAPGTNKVKVIQSMDGVASDPSDLRTFTVKPPKPAISQPPSPAAPKQVLTITGVASGTVSLEMFNEAGTKIGGSFSPTGTTRTFTPTADWAPGTNKVKVIQTVNGIASEPSDLCTFSVSPQKPVITIPVESGFIELGSSFSGSNGYAGPGSRVSLQEPNHDREWAHAIPGTNGSWTSTRLPHSPGPQELHVRVYLGNEHSEYVARKFNVRPPLPRITGPSAASGPRPTVIGTGYEGATVNVVQQNNATPVLATATVVNGNWVATLSANRPDLPAGPYLLSAQQIVKGVPSGWLNPPFEIRVRPPKPAITPPPFPAASKQTLTITNVYSGSVSLKMLDGNNVQVPGNFTGSGTSRTFTPTRDWASGTNTVKVVQTVSDVESEASDPCVFSTQPSRLAILPPSGMVGPRQPLTIVGVHDNATGFKMRNGAGTLLMGDFSGDGSRRTFTPAQNWVPGSNTVTVVQIVSGVDSEPSDACIFRAQPISPAITPPASPATPTQTLTITDVLPGAVFTMFERLPFGEVHGNYAGNGATRVFTPRDPWKLGEHEIQIKQTVNAAASELSEPCAFTVTLEKPAAPTVGFPSNNQVIDMMSSYSGAQGYAGTGSRVALYVPNSEAELAHATPEVTGSWTSTAVPLSPGPRVIRVRVEVGSAHSDEVVRSFKVRPPVPEITSPSSPAEPRQALTITRVYSGSATLTMSDSMNRPIVGDFTNGGAGIRIFTPRQDWALGENTVKVVQIVEGVESIAAWCTFIVAPEKPQTPIIEHPEQNQIIDLNSTCSGTRGFPEPGALVLVREPDTDHEWAFALPTVDGSWTSSILPQGPGAHEVHVLVVVGERYSDPVPLAFKIRPPKPAITPPPTPVELLQRLTITGIYSASAILELINGAGDPVPGLYDGSGKERVFTPDQAWPLGVNKVTVKQTEGGVTSVPSDECIFTVVEQEKPEAPQIKLPPANSTTPRRPVIEARGMPDALITVRLQDGEVLHSAPADAEGVLVFIPEKPLDPGPNALEVKQQGSGPESEWSAPHSFTVKIAPQKPGIDAPTEGSRVASTFDIRGTGEGRGDIQIRHADDPDNLIVSIEGVRNWRWTVAPPWEVGAYRIQVRLVDETDSSEWTDPRAFEVVDARLLIGATGSVVAQPVVGNNESVLLRVQVVASESWEAIEGLSVEWSVVGEPGVRATTLTDSNGWAHYLYTPDTPGEHRVQADVTSENEGVMTIQLFEVTALEENSWEQPFGLYLNGKKITPARDELVLVHGTSYELELRVNNPSQKDSIVSLEDLADAVQQGLEFDPPLGAPQTITVGTARWTIASGSGGNGFFGLKLTSSILPDWHLPGRMLSNDLAEDLYMYFDSYRTIFGRAAFPCHGGKHELTMAGLPGSHLLGKKVTLQWMGDSAADLGIVVTPDPAFSQLIDDTNFVGWEFDCVNSIKDGIFAVQLNVDDLNFKSMPLMMGLAHNAIKVSETFGPEEVGGYYRYGVRAVSLFTEQVAGGSPVLVKVTGREPVVMSTEENGWIYVNYYEGESASLTLISPYLDMAQQPWPGP